ncbi:MAG: phosphate ABC transporter substrate-binding protein [Nitrospinota bacterium]|nr:phosphate ABC transporter substrate-binding protein [Nitrospinota bacterium]
MKQTGLAMAAALLIATSAAMALEVDKGLEQYKPQSGVSGSVKTVGSDTLNNLMTLWAEGFRAMYPAVKVEIEGKGSSTAPPALIQGAAGFGPMSREMKSDEEAGFERKFGYKPSRARVAVDALAVFVNKDNPIKCLSLSQVDAIFSKTRKGGAPKEISSWGELGLTGEWATKRMSVYGRNSASGTYGYFKEHALFKGDFKDSVKEQPGSSAVAQAVAADKGAIGYSGVGYKTADVRIVPLDNGAGECVEGNAENAYNGEYPLARFLFIYVNKKPGEKLDPLRGEFIRYIFSRQGQTSVLKDGYFPISQAVADQDMKALGIK